MAALPSGGAKSPSPLPLDVPLGPTFWTLVHALLRLLLPLLQNKWLFAWTMWRPVKQQLVYHST